ncbi:MAG: SUMF1/EgtB/PvdO family nonheme iron enzyme [Phycisphaerae bacterium]|nr:SUMF1/EgtB/PvdO family nonheme iron enzyme [Phycisphaerae bacterium]
MNALILRASVFVLVVALLAGTAMAVNIETVPVGNPGNAGELSGSGAGGYGPNRICGAVAYTYNIGKYEVTAGQYTEFLNKVAAADMYGLYNTYMWSDTYGCKIQRSGSSGSYTYSVASNYANRPVNYVSWGDSVRFANWLHNGQPTGPQGAGTTETGAYTLNGAMTDAELSAVTRNVNWKWAITSEDEWYKAAYHKNDGITGNYWPYPTSSDHINTSMANYGMSVGHTTDVGGYLYPSPYGTFDQGGNVWEWNEAAPYSAFRGERGGSFSSYDGDLLASGRNYGDYPTYECVSIGFRVSEVPEPTSLALLAFGGIGMVVRRGGLRR